jgi:O-antigen ligase
VAFGSKIELDPSQYFRLFTFYQSLKLLAAHPLTGVGPGMFGGLASIFWDSPVYKHWPEVMLWYLKRIRSLDLFWPQIWAELGLIGLSLNWAFFASLFFFFKENGSFL